MRTSTPARYLQLLKEAKPESKVEVIETLNDKIEMSERVSRAQMWDQLIESDFEWSSEDLHFMILCWDGPLAMQGYKWLFKHPQLTFRSLATLGYRAHCGAWSSPKEEEPGRRAFQALEKLVLDEDITQGKLLTTYNLSRSFWQVPNPENRLATSVGNYQNLLGALVEPSMGGSAGRMEVFNRLHLDGWNGKLEELVGASISLA